MTKKFQLAVPNQMNQRHSVSHGIDDGVQNMVNAWVISQDMENKINAFATSCYRVMLNIKRIDHVLNFSMECNKSLFSALLP